MHIHFIGIGGAGIGPLAIVAKKAGYYVSGSDLQNSDTVDYLKGIGIKEIIIGDHEKALQQINSKNPVDWVVYTSSLTVNTPNPPVLHFAKQNNIKATKRDAFLVNILKLKKLKLIAIAGTHGKTTTTAMLVWLYKSFNIPISYLLPATTNYADLGDYDEDSEYFIYEADEFDYNFLSFSPEISIISGVSYDHHEIFKTVEIYKKAFIDFIAQSNNTLMYKNDATYLGLNDGSGIGIISDNDPLIAHIKLLGLYNRRDALLVSKIFSSLSNYSLENILKIVSEFPGLHRRMEQIYPNLYTDYAHTPEKIKAALNVAKEMVEHTNQKIIVIYEPLTNRRQLHIQDQYGDTFKDADQLYWIDSYLAREDPNDPIIPPSELIKKIANPEIAEPQKRGPELLAIIKKHLANGDFVIGIAGGGGNSLDEWLRKSFLS